jgi:hypothetical protein
MRRGPSRSIKGWPPTGIKRGYPLGGRSAISMRPMMPTDKRSGSEQAPDRGTPASDAFRFPMREKMPTKDPEDG